MEISLAALPPPPLQRAFHSDPEASKAGSLSAEHLGGMTAAPSPASAYRAPGEATPPPSGRALPSTTLIGFARCGGGRMPPPLRGCWVSEGGATCLPPPRVRGLLSGGRGLGSGSGSVSVADLIVEGGVPPWRLSWRIPIIHRGLPSGRAQWTKVSTSPSAPQFPIFFLASRPWWSPAVWGLRRRELCGGASGDIWGGRASSRGAVRGYFR